MFKGIWHRATDEYRKIRALNEAEPKTALDRDRKELHSLVRSRILECRELQKTTKTYKEEIKTEALRIRQQIALYVSTTTEPPAPQVVKAIETVPVAVQLAAQSFPPPPKKPLVGKTENRRANLAYRGRFRQTEGTKNIRHRKPYRLGLETA